MKLPCDGWLGVGAQKYNPQVDQTSDNFVEGNLKHSINGYLFCNMPDVGATPTRSHSFMPQLTFGSQTGCASFAVEQRECCFLSAICNK